MILSASAGGKLAQVTSAQTGELLDHLLLHLLCQSLPVAVLA